MEATAEYWVELPLLYSSFLLVTRFIQRSVSMSISISQFTLTPIILVNIYFLHLYLYFCFVDELICTFFYFKIPHISEII